MAKQNTIDELLAKALGVKGSTTKTAGAVYQDGQWIVPEHGPAPIGMGDIDRLLVGVEPEPYSNPYRDTHGHKGVSPARGAVMEAGARLRDAGLPLGIGELAGDSLYNIGNNTPSQLAWGAADAAGIALDVAGLGAPARRAAQYAAKSLKRQNRFVGKTVPVTHYGRTTDGFVDTGYHGTGIKGEERLRADMPGYQDRAYFYESGQVGREPGLPAEGWRGKATRVLVDNKKRAKLYKEAAARVRKRYEGGRAEPIPPKGEVMNEFEQILLENGYRGYTRADKVVVYLDNLKLNQPTRSIAARGRLSDQELEEYVRANPGGSIDPLTGEMPTKGIAVATRGHEQIIPGRATAEQIRDYTASNKDVLEKPDHYLGWWYDEDTGNTFLDVSQVVPKNSEVGRKAQLQARALGEGRYQRAVYDIGEGEEIDMWIRPTWEKYQGWRAANAQENIPGYGRVGPNTQRGAVGGKQPTGPMNEVERSDYLHQKMREETGKWRSLADQVTGRKQTEFAQPVKGQAFGQRGAVGDLSARMDIASEGRGGSATQSVINERMQAGINDAPTPVDYSLTMIDGKEIRDWTPQDFEAYGRRWGVDNLGPITPYQKVEGFDIPGGLEGRFTYYDLIDLKSRGINPNSLSPETHAKLQRKMAESMTPDVNNPMQVFNRYMFGLLSPNQPLTPNEFEAARLMVRSPADIRRLARFIDWEPGEKVSKARRKAAELEMVKFFNTNSAGTGGMGLKGTADYTNIAELAKMFEKNPEWFTRRQGEAWEQFLERVQTQVRGATSKVSSFMTVWQDPSKAGISAIDRHMINRFWPRMPATEKAEWAKDRVPLWNKYVDKERDKLKKAKEKLTHDYKNKVPQKTKAGEDRPPLTQKQYAAKMKKLRSSPVLTLRKVRKYGDIKGQHGGVKWLDGQKMSYITAAKTVTLKGAKGPSRNVPAWARDEDWPGDPDKAVLLGDNYRAALELNRQDAAEHGLNLFESQWMLWDRIRNRLEPHEIMMPGLEKLPPMHKDELIRALKEHKQAGYMSTARDVDKETGEVLRQRPVRSMRPSSSAYWGAAGGGVLADQYYRQKQGGM